MMKKEILFLWDGENWNPNGDMLNDNAPRIDEETGVAEATDVRIKRTIRDELIKKEGGDTIFVKPYLKGNSVLDCKYALRSLIDITQSRGEIETQLLDRFIDLRAFGGVLPISDKKEMDKIKKMKDKENIQVASVTFTGAVQFRMSKSLHKVHMKHIKGTGAFASTYSENEGKEQKQQDTIREEDFLSYALFATYGIMDNYNATKTGFNEDDAKKIIDALWFGTKNLITRSKMGQTPRFMLVITYKDDTFAGDLNNSIDFVGSKDDEAIRSVNDYKIDFSRLKAKLERYKGSIEKVEYLVDYDFESNHQEQFESSWTKIER
ncbi:MAG: type I-B CRISPR-associated protein Cas7/Csh2 [Epsilonproteobacteria bacterium]|nr:type I-B CRISPR-associated protein Cas7/Csh2 [Campylobacterota bacterium]